MSHNTMQIQPTGSEVSKVESDIAQTLSLADTIVTLVREPVALLYQNIKKSKAIKRSIGKWKKEAFDADKECRTPVVRLPGVEKYLIEHDGILHPDSEVPAKGCWAYFLHALGVRSGMDIVEWKPAIDGYVNTRNGGIEMEIDGAALCHIINLYRADDNLWVSRDTRLPRSEESKSCRFLFGKLAWESTNGQLHAHFQPGSVREIQSTKHPFGAVGKLLGSNTLVTSYFNALDIGVSDPSFSLLEPTAPLLERINKLMDCIRRMPIPFKSDPLLITYEWLENAARVKKRALAGGGKDRSFYDDICREIDQHTQLRGDFKSTMKAEIRDCFLFDEDPVDFWILGARQRSIPLYKVKPEEVVMRTLEKYSSEPLGSWKYDIYTMRTDVARLATHPFRFYLNEKLWVLQFDRRSAFWHERVLLGAPIDR